MPAAGVRHISHRRFLATFPLAAVGRAEQDLYRCVSQAPRGAGVSNFAELIVKGERAGARGGGARTLRVAAMQEGRGLAGPESGRGARSAEGWGRQGLTGGGALSPGRRSDPGGGV